MFYGTSATRYPENIGFTVEKLNSNSISDWSNVLVENAIEHGSPADNFTVIEWRVVNSFVFPFVLFHPTNWFPISVRLVFAYAAVVPPYLNPNRAIPVPSVFNDCLNAALNVKK